MKASSGIPKVAEAVVVLENALSIERAVVSAAASLGTSRVAETTTLAACTLRTTAEVLTLRRAARVAA